jgi:hypothetical protein
MMTRPFDHESATDILVEESPAFRRDEAMRHLRRELVELVFQCARSGMTNVEKLIVIAEIAKQGDVSFTDPTSEQLRGRHQWFESISDHASWTTDAKRFLALAGDEYQTAAKKLAKDEPITLECPAPSARRRAS